MARGPLRLAGTGRPAIEHRQGACPAADAYPQGLEAALLWLTKDGLSTSTKVTSPGVIASIQQHGHTPRRGEEHGMGEDQWARWLLRDRSGGDQTQQAGAMRILLPVRDRVLRGAKVAPGDTVLDLGTGDGLIGFGALPLVGEHGTVIFSEVSEELRP
jgi:hypothetical protein